MYRFRCLLLPLFASWCQTDETHPVLQLRLFWLETETEALVVSDDRDESTLLIIDPFP